jgi:hypothetical protein
VSTRAELPAALPVGVAMSWPELAGVLTDLSAQAPGRYALRDSFMALRQIDEELKSLRPWRPATDDRFIIIKRAIYLTTDTAIATWLAKPEPRHSAPPGAERRYQVVDVAPMEGDNVIAFRKPATDGWVQSQVHPGLWKKTDRPNLTISFRHGRAEATFDLRTGQLVDQSDGGDFPGPTWHYITDRVRQLPAPHRQPPKEIEAAPGRATSEVQPPQESALPMVGAASPSVKENLPMLDLSNPTVVAQARAVAMNINKALAIPEIEAQRRTLKASYRQAEQAYRHTEVDLSEATRRVSQIKASLKDRADELLFVATELKADTPKPKYPSASSLATALKTAIKTDAPYTATQAELKVLEAQLKTAANDDKPGIDQAIAGKREALVAREAALQEQLQAETVADLAPRYTSAEARSAAAINLRRTDAEYLAIKGELATAEQAVYLADKAYADAKAEQRILAREWADLDKATDLAVARINAFGGLDAPAPSPAAAAV